MDGNEVVGTSNIHQVENQERVLVHDVERRNVKGRGNKRSGGDIFNNIQCLAD